MPDLPLKLSHFLSRSTKINLPGVGTLAFGSGGAVGGGREHQRGLQWALAAMLVPALISYHLLLIALPSPQALATHSP